MYEKETIVCPACGFENPRRLDEQDRFVCQSCGSQFVILADEESGQVALAEEKAGEPAEPLWLPRGSIRASVALVLAAACWFLIGTNEAVPSYLLSLLLTVIGYYFGFRGRGAPAQSRIYDPTGRPRTPLFLPGRMVRRVLVIGFLAAAVVLLIRQKPEDIRYLGFFVVLFGLMLGHFAGRMIGRLKGGPLYPVINHLKGVLVLAVAAYLTVLFVTGAYSAGDSFDALPVMSLCAFISFYYGSRT